MKRQCITMALIAGFAGFAMQIGMAAPAQDKQPSQTTPSAAPMTDQQKLSYAMGFETGKAFKGHGVQIDPNTFTAGMRDGMMGNKPRLTPEQVKEVLYNFQKQSQQRFLNKMKAIAEKNLQAGEAFLKANKAKPGVVTTPSGIQYKVLEKGTGPKPSVEDTVTVNYEGRLATTNKVFDSSYKRGQPATFPLSGVIKGWQEVLPMMPVGSTWEVYIPANLAYGARGVPGSIGPNEVLVFKINLISIANKSKSDADKS